MNPESWFSVFPSFRQEVFMGLVHYFFLKLSMVLETHVMFCVTELDFWRKWRKWTKNSFLSVLENLDVNFSWICSVKKVYVNCCILAQIPYVRKILFPKYVTKCTRPIDCRIFILTISLEQNDEKARFCAC